MLLDNGSVKIVAYNGTDTTVKIPDEIDGMTVTSIAAEIFAEGTESVEVIVPATVTQIDENAFDASDVTIYGEEGSYAEQYAEENAIAFVSTSVEQVLMGDINFDGLINSVDAIAIVRNAAGYTALTTDKAKYVADVNSDSNINAVDALAILRYNASLTHGTLVGTYMEYDGE